MKSFKSFERAIFEGQVQGPGWAVVNEEGHSVVPGSQDYGHTRLGRSVKLSAGHGNHISSVIDYQHPADTPAELRDPAVGYEGSAQESRFRDV